ncbi:MAG TPA: hypothetical protein VM347_05770, partial [Nonomuraea sp.]|nr:hypothetical protein [Nonomuraea sp.]
RRLPYAVLEAQDEKTDLTRALRSGAGTLIITARVEPEPRLDGWADRVRMVRTGPLPEVEAAAMLVRPDGRIVWASDTGRDPGLTEALTRWFGEPRTP